MNRLLLFVGIVGLALTTPLAAAQSGSTAALVLSPPMEYLTHETASWTAGTITYSTSMASAALNTNGWTVVYTVAKQPEWAIVTISPSSDILHSFISPSPTMVISKTFNIGIEVDPNYFGEAIDQIEIIATVIPSAAATQQIVSTKSSMSVHALTDEDHCENAATAAIAPAPVKEEAPETVTIQSASPATSPVPYVAIGGFAAVGAGIGLLLRRRF